MPTIDLRSILQETVSGWYGDLVTRPTGHAVRRGVEEVLAEYDADQVAVIDFSSVRLLDLSCADEVVAKLLLQYGRTRPFLLRGSSEDHQEALEPVLRGHGLAAVARDRRGRAHFLGVITERLRVALIMLAERGSAGVGSVARGRRGQFEGSTVFRRPGISSPRRGRCVPSRAASA